MRVLYYLLTCGWVLYGLSRWIDVTQEAVLSQKPLPENYSGLPTQVKSVGVAVLRGCGRFVLYASVGTITSRIFCELLLSAFLLRDALYAKLQQSDAVPLVRPVAAVAEGGGGFSMAGSAGARGSSGYQTVA